MNLLLHQRSSTHLPFSMALTSKTNYVHESSAPPPIKQNQQFPVIAIAVMGIFATAFLLVGYYIFAIKCCLISHRIDIFRHHFSFSRTRRRDEPLMVFSPARESRGLDESVIRSIPLFQFKKASGRSLNCECAICLYEFHEEAKLKKIPTCSHLFHIDCIDVWLQNNANCPLCRTGISSSSLQDPNPDSAVGEEDFLVIELREDQSLQRSERNRERKFHQVASMGDEWVDIREKDEQFAVQPIRRSISMDSSNDRQLILAVQEIMRRNGPGQEESPGGEGCSSRIKRSFFSFGQGRGASRNAVLPIRLEA